MPNLKVTEDSGGGVVVSIQDVRTPWCKCCLCDGPMYSGEPYVWSNDGSGRQAAHVFRVTCEWHRDRALRP